MGSPDDTPASLLQGTLDMLILKCLARGSLHGYDIAEWIEQRCEEVLRVDAVWR